MKRYYFVINYVPEHANQELLAGRCISTLHDFLNFHHISGIGVGFPSWTQQSLGKQILFCSSNQQRLSQLHQSQYFLMMAEQGLFVINDVEPVPADTAEVRFYRNQGIAKLFTGGKRRRLERAKRRAAERGEAFDPEKIGSNQPIEMFHRILIDSQSTQQRFVLHVQKEKAAEVSDAEFNGYGLATNQTHRGTVPDIRVSL
ncbi:type I-F CRISPR-associated endoribonuclease Cas6/Csy4 [Enterovibrio sp. ZSDZ42]|uniref:Type I-F CRISPR-associated endoribonuclease Cas6/Csy4 n=1 Tax=Enterovibrio gelatinilyticus TaxID=2899819 RepID=A0ABT5R232_9GAMM|nr:type I-F CRISPR-associated endoribonuclease Cas6/Csy4 [Enterovibrio sp. ZSDZ42]MDD1794332.1 type I-F CRISPR-associated endoribonuclease Cas6/Csy4 [Enterovibrio sp. ZSDZ42]